MYKNGFSNITDEIFDVLSVINIAKINQLKIYIKKLYPNITYEKIDQEIEKMKKIKTFFEPIEGYLSLDPNISKDIKKITSAVQFFWLYLVLLDSEKLPFDPARYPSDYVMAKGENVYEIIIYSDQGNYKLNYLKSRKRYNENTIIIVLILNNDETSIQKNNLPPGKYQFVSIYMDPQNINETPKLTASLVYEIGESNG